MNFCGNLLMLETSNELSMKLWEKFPWSSFIVSKYAH